MKLPIKKEYFDAIKNGNKIFEYRDSHITFICGKETLTKKVIGVRYIPRNGLPMDIRHKDIFTDNFQIEFELE